MKENKKDKGKDDPTDDITQVLDELRSKGWDATSVEESVGGATRRVQYVSPTELLKATILLNRYQNALALQAKGYSSSGSFIACGKFRNRRGN